MSDARGAEEPTGSEAWRDVTSGFVDLGNRLRTYFETSPEDETGNEAGNEVSNAWGEFTDAAHRLGRTVASALEDEDIQEDAKRAFNSLVDAVGRSVREAGVQFPWESTSEGDQQQDRPGSEEA